MKPLQNSYNHTIRACFVGYIVQAMVNNFVPLLFLTFQRSYDIPLTQITLLVTINFAIQLLVDLLAVGFVDKIGYRVSMVIAHFSAAAGLIMLAFLPDKMTSPFLGILLSVALYAVGGGLLEVLVSPVVEACPSENKEQTMSILHSFYCWGYVGVVLISTIFFQVVGISHWKILTVFWALIPIGNGMVFCKVPMNTLIEEGEEGESIKSLFSNRFFWILFVMMICAGASEQAVSQWASTFVEKGLQISKTAGDLAGPMSFAILMGSSRAFFGKYGAKLNLERFMALSGMLSVISYLLLSFSPLPVFSLLGCALCGLSVGIMWPGTFSKASGMIPKGGTAMFAFLALGGDLGCAGGPTLVGVVSGMLGDNMKKGFLAGILFPILLLGGLFLCRKKRESAT